MKSNGWTSYRVISLECCFLRGFNVKATWFTLRASESQFSNVGIECLRAPPKYQANLFAFLLG
jgi:hypothetical protein